MRTCGIGIIEDNKGLAKNIEDYLCHSRDYFLVFNSTSPDEILKAEYPPDVILLDIHLGNANGIEMLYQLQKNFPKSAIIIMTGDDDEQLVLKAMERGARGYITKPFMMDALLRTIDKVLHTGCHMDETAVSRLIDAISRRNNVHLLQIEYQLTDREMDILMLIKAGHSYKKVAEQLKISYHTVNHHLKSAYTKLDINSRSELVARYML